MQSILSSVFKPLKKLLASVAWNPDSDVFNKLPQTINDVPSHRPINLAKKKWLWPQVLKRSQTLNVDCILTCQSPDNREDVVQTPGRLLHYATW